MAVFVGGVADDLHGVLVSTYGTVCAQAIELRLEHTVADNIDLRYEFFPKGSEQVMVGLFYKHLHNPIEYGLINEGQDTYYKPMNFGNATNAGVEIDVMKNFKFFGVKANYTFTHSRITTSKRTMQGSEVISVNQSRPLFGQAAHVANVSLLYKSSRWPLLRALPTR